MDETTKDFSFLNSQDGGMRLADQAALKMRQMIVSGKIRMGDPVAEVALSKLFGMSRTPIREAISQLEQEGLLKIIPGRGAFVAEITVQDIQEINELRRVLEPLALESALDAITDSEIEFHDKLWKKFAAQYEETGECPDSGLLTAADHDLHELFSRKCRNRRLRNFLNILRIQTIQYMSAYWGTEEHVGEIIGQHIRILENLRLRNVERAQEALREHICFNRLFYTSS